MSEQAFSVVTGTWAVVRLPSAARIPPWAADAREFSSVTRTMDELSIVVEESIIPPDQPREGNWSLLKLRGPIAFDQVGVLASVAAPLASQGISIFAISTFETDYLLVKSLDVDRARDCLEAAGHTLI